MTDPTRSRVATDHVDVPPGYNPTCDCADCTYVRNSTALAGEYATPDRAAKWPNTEEWQRMRNRAMRDPSKVQAAMEWAFEYGTEIGLDP